MCVCEGGCARACVCLSKSNSVTLELKKHSKSANDTSCQLIENWDAEKEDCQKICKDKRSLKQNKRL